MNIIARAETALAFPTQTVSLERGKQPNEEIARATNKRVNGRRERYELHIARLPDKKISSFVVLCLVYPWGALSWQQQKRF